MILPPIVSPDQINNDWAADRDRVATPPAPDPITVAAFQELREPLTALWLGTEYIRDHLSESALQREGLIFMQANLLEVERLTTNLQYLTAPPPFMATPGRLESLLNRLILTWEQLFAARHISLRFQTSADLPSLSFDADRLNCALNNLFAFCFKELAVGDRLYLTLTGSAQGQVISFNYDQLPIRQGGAIAAIAAKSAFQDLDTKSWLALTRHLIEQHHGQFRLQSETEYSGKLIIVLPLHGLDSA